VNTLRPEVLSNLHAICPHVVPSDLSACWHNAHRHWKSIAPQYLTQREPAEFAAARTLFVLGMNHPNPAFRAKYMETAYILLTPFLG